MRGSCNRHVLSLVRRELGLSQTAFANAVGCAPSYIQSIESGRRSLSELRALKIGVATGVTPRWLILNEFEAPMVEMTTGKPYSKAYFLRAQARLQAPATRRQREVEEEMFLLTALLWSALSAAEKRSPETGALGIFRFRQLVNELLTRFGTDAWMFDGKEPNRASKVLATKMADHARLR